MGSFRAVGVVLVAVALLACGTPDPGLNSASASQRIELGGLVHQVTLSFDVVPRVGNNAYVVTVEPAVDDLTLVAHPVMATMGHGSAGSVNPTSVGGGAYAGTANLSMVGDWVLQLELFSPGGALEGKLEWKVSL